MQDPNLEKDKLLQMFFAWLAAHQMEVCGPVPDFLLGGTRDGLTD